MDAFSRYHSTGLPRVDGWLNPVSAAFIGAIAACQRRQGWTGSCGEIGVHHGKLFLVLHLLRDPDRQSFAIDLFEDQHLNSDGSGKGDYGAFVRNIQTWAGDPDEVRIFKGSSLELDPARVVEACGRSRLFSIDGGHTEECTRNDLKIAEAVSEPYGVVIIDDVFNEFFPEVAMGLQSYVAKGRLRPFAITPNKVLLTDPQYAGVYRDWARADFGHRYDKTCVMFGAEVDLFGIRYASYPGWKQVLRDSSLYPSLKKFKDQGQRRGAGQTPTIQGRGRPAATDSPGETSGGSRMRKTRGRNLIAESVTLPAGAGHDQPSLAVLIVNYNYERYVTEAIESALAQTPAFDEIIVVNDGSTDNSMQAINAYADRLMIVDKPNGGVLTATMAGLARSRADYVYVLDADDLLEPDFVARVRPCLATGPVKVQCQLTGIDAEGKPLVSVFPTYPAGYDSARMRSDNEQIGFYICPPTSGNIYRRKFLDRIDLSRLGSHEPLDGPPALAAPYFGEVLTIDRPLARYRVHGRNDSRWDRPDAQLLKGEIDWFFRRWGDVGAMLGGEAPPFGSAKPLYVRERELMMSALADGEGLAAYAMRFISRLWVTHVTGRQKLILTAWALALLAPVRRLRRFLVNARRSPVNRPAGVKRLLTSLLGARASA